MNSSSSQNTGNWKSTLKGIVILILLVIGAGAGGYFFGTYQKFAPIQSVPAGTPGAISMPSSASTIATAPQAVAGGSTLKKKYWIDTRGDNHIGYSVTVFVNGQLVDKFFSPGRDVEITKFVKPGENQVNFQAELLPESMNEHKGLDNYWLNLAIADGDKVDSNPPENSVLLNYKRTAREATDGKTYNDTLTFLTME